MAGCYLPHRVRLFFLVMTGVALHMSVRSNFNISLVAMVNYTTPMGHNATIGDNTTSVHSCPGVNLVNDTSNDPTQQGEFFWSSSQQSQLLSSYYYGYIILQPTGGILAHKWGGRRVLGFIMFAAAVCTSLVPIVARIPYSWSYAALVTLRALTGLFTSPFLSVVVSLWSNWAPKNEVTLLLGGSMSGVILGEVVSFSTAGALCQSTFLGGWPAVFYIYGVVMLLWVVCWFLLASDTPQSDTTISQQERTYILENIEKQDTNVARQLAVGGLVRSPAVLSYWLLTATDALGFDVLFTCLPIYMKQVLGVDMRKNGVFVGLQYTGSIITSMVACPIADYFRSRELLSTRAVRVISSIIAECGMACCLFLIAMLFECDSTAVFCLLVLGNAMYSMNASGFTLTPMDIAPNYAGTVYGVANFFGSTVGLLTPIIVEEITGNSGNRDQWKLTFMITGCAMTIGVVTYSIFAKGTAILTPSDNDTEKLLGQPSMEEHGEYIPNCNLTEEEHSSLVINS